MQRFRNDGRWRMGLTAYGLAIVLLLFVSGVFAAGWSSGTGPANAKVIRIQHFTGSTAAWVQLENSLNVNSCNQSSGWFWYLDPTTPAGKIVLATLHEAMLSGKLVRIYSAGCANNPTYNTLDGVEIGP